MEIYQNRDHSDLERVVESIIAYWVVSNVLINDRTVKDVCAFLHIGSNCQKNQHPFQYKKNKYKDNNQGTTTRHARLTCL